MQIRNILCTAIAFSMAAIAQATNVHTWSQTDVLHACQCDDISIIIITILIEV